MLPLRDISADIRNFVIGWNQFSSVFFSLTVPFVNTFKSNMLLSEKSQITREAGLGIGVGVLLIVCAVVCVVGWLISRRRRQSCRTKDEDRKTRSTPPSVSRESSSRSAPPQALAYNAQIFAPAWKDNKYDYYFY